MLTLAVDTATPQVSAAVGSDERLLASFRSLAGRRHGETLAPGLAFLAGAAGIALSDIQMVAVDAGPGLFTGLRVGLATAKALASALEIRVQAFTSTDVLAFPHRAQDRPVAAVVDARRHEVFWAVYDGAGRRQGEPQVAAPDDAARALAASCDPSAGLLIVGDGALRYRGAFAATPGAEIGGPEWAYPGAEAVLAMAAAPAAGTGLDPLDPLDPLDVRALYGRQADVRIGWEQRCA
ncbi:MAG TPA: tRNA (adenosine(37)-N6)-threonylcarbamoyltransferase complex dimerization subunit type 1 TsaB [Acidimicrobiales bacterium]|nr:tRNA (adenosine(37)-N6)-threonylcarbamoyltransferase complex dimerization subunit type 1 TsaB [Acidimicrobiales bacterium]